MEKVNAKLIQMGAAGLGGLFAKTVYVFEVDGKQIKYNMNRFLAGSTPDMYTEGELTLDNGEFVAFDYDGGYLAINTRKPVRVEIPKK